MAAERKPTVDDLATDLETLSWRPNRGGDGAIEIAFAEALGQRWVLMRIVGDPANFVTVYNRHEWDCFVDAAKAGEFDDPV